ncbi:MULTISPECIES: TetR/AcrR family transcriptional regulator [unclassified Streptomyces]|uniref:TetR/AcrR family transcriptional regulator n=1 Tax=unclassified Streptomyces TaxID=2593676 RepID=UPI0023653933|nr:MULTISPECIES: TetR/AcrR family transcriptional regulator [unclassified Streptomyces]MDF3144135.1 TetR/AcrR family transcriptional regulator [Streptomyces sp. T21Q-yed]WDF38879.1 TetR/AcrR family transcriptional regulator [Streptomyces sp. T12]
MTVPAPAHGTLKSTKWIRASRQRAILRATYEVLAESGYEGLRYEAVAARARASKATLYRHRRTKGELVTVAVRASHVTSLAVPDTGTLRGDLVASVDGLAELASGQKGAVIAGLFLAVRHDAELAAGIRPLAMLEESPGRVICARAEKRGELPPGHDARLVDEIVLPLLTVKQSCEETP